MINQNSRFITYPSTVDKIRDTVIVIDIKPADFIVLTDFLKSTDSDFDVYLYDGESHDLEWLNHVTKDCDHVLIDDASQVRISPESTNVRYGPGLEYQTPYGYFTKLVDDLAELSV
jgi:hypothetical protein